VDVDLLHHKPDFQAHSVGEQTIAPHTIHFVKNDFI